MKTLISTLTILLLFSCSATAQSLAELAKKEKERREKMREVAKTLTNEDTSRYKGGAITTVTLSTSTATAETGAAKPEDPTAGAAAMKPVPTDEPVDLLGRPESFWKQTFTDARQKVKELENEANVITLKLNDLQNRFYQESSGFGQQQIQRDIQKTIYEQDLNAENLAKAKALLQDLETEARKSGALPGWLNPKP